MFKSNDDVISVSQIHLMKIYFRKISDWTLWLVVLGPGNISFNEELCADNYNINILITKKHVL